MKYLEEWGYYSKFDEIVFILLLSISWMEATKIGKHRGGLSMSFNF